MEPVEKEDSKPFGQNPNKLDIGEIEPIASSVVKEINQFIRGE